MQAFDLEDGQFRPAVMPFVGEPVLPADSIVLQRTPLTIDSFNENSWQIFWNACQILQQQISAPKYIFLDASWDPFRMTSKNITRTRKRLGKMFVGSKICVLSACARHFYEDIPGCVYFPAFLMINYPDLNFRPRSGRIGCLNRRNALHRIVLMHQLLKRNLIDSKRDIFSVSFINHHTGNEFNFTGHTQHSVLAQELKTWPKTMATHDDGFINDYSIDHPAWHTGIAIITETEPGIDTIVCEKTAKGILSKSCFSIYMSETGYRVLEDLGFQPRFFTEHAEDFNIKPIIDICQNIRTQNQALEYRQQHIDKIEHNFNWFGFRQGNFDTRPWWPMYEPKLRQVLDNL